VRLQGEGVRTLVKGRIFTPDGIIDGCVTIENGVITRVGGGSSGCDSVLEFSGEGEVVLPGLIDMHVHMRDFEQSSEEDFTSGTSAAAMGGYTVVVDMPNTKPPVNTLQALLRRDAAARERAIVDYGLYYGIPRQAGELGDEIQRLAVGFKLFMHMEFYPEPPPTVLDSLRFAAGRGLPVVVHAEDPMFFRDLGMGPAGTPEAEASAISRISGTAEEIGFRPHVTHLSSELGLREVIRWRKRVGLTSDTCPCYLLLTREDVERIGPVAKVHPPIKESRDREALLASLARGEIDAVSSDHAPHLPCEKRSMKEASPGFPGLETTLPLMLTLVNRGRMELRDLVRACAEAPARILGLEKLGSVEEGKIGNLTVVDLEKRGRIDPGTFVSRAKYSPFEGFETIGAPVAVVVRGKQIMERGRIVSGPGWCRNVTAFR